MSEHEQYAMLRSMAEGAEDLAVPAVIVRELLAERDALEVALERKTDEHEVTWRDWKRQRTRAEDAEASRDSWMRSHAQDSAANSHAVQVANDAADAAAEAVGAMVQKLTAVMVSGAEAVDLMNAQFGCPDCGVHHACGEIVAERDRLRAVVGPAHELLDAEMDADSWTDYHTALKAAVDQLDEVDGHGPAEPVTELAVLRRNQIDSDADYIEQLEGLSLGQEEAAARLRNALLMVEAVTDIDVAHGYARAALDLDHAGAEAGEIRDGERLREAGGRPDAGRAVPGAQGAVRAGGAIDGADDPVRPAAVPGDVSGDVYVCPNHVSTGGWEACCGCGGWSADDPDHGRLCSEEIARG